MNATKAEIAAVFSEWQRRNEQDPDAFGKRMESDYGESCSSYFLELLAEIRERDKTALT